MDLPRGQWSLLNRFRSDAGPCRNSMHEWGYIASPLCDCGEHQTMRHVVNECPLTCFDGGISELHKAHDAAFNWLLRQNLRSWKANDNNNNPAEECTYSVAGVQWCQKIYQCNKVMYSPPPPYLLFQYRSGSFCHCFASVELMRTSCSTRTSTMTRKWAHRLSCHVRHTGNRWSRLPLYAAYTARSYTLTRSCGEANIVADILAELVKSRLSSTALWKRKKKLGLQVLKNKDFQVGKKVGKNGKAEGKNYDKRRNKTAQTDWPMVQTTRGAIHKPTKASCSRHSDPWAHRNQLAETSGIW